MKKAKRECDQQQEFYLFGEVKLKGVVFTITASSKDEAIQKAEAGKFECYDASTAEMADWKISTRRFI